jgi:hypothetical protein
VKRVKKSKAYYELIVLRKNYRQNSVMTMKAKTLIETVVAGENHFEGKTNSDEIKKYISRKTEAIQNQFKKANVH